MKIHIHCVLVLVFFFGGEGLFFKGKQVKCIKDFKGDNNVKFLQICIQLSCCSEITKIQSCGKS